MAMPQYRRRIIPMAVAAAVAAADAAATVQTPGLRLFQAGQGKHGSWGSDTFSLYDQSGDEALLGLNAATKGDGVGEGDLLGDLLCR
jgi:hypothetical protein